MNESKFTTPMAIVVAGALIGAAIYFSGTQPLELGGRGGGKSSPSATGGGGAEVGGGSAPVEDPSRPTPLPEKVEVSIEGEPFWGEEDAPVTLVEFTDYQCPFCKRAFDTMWEKLKKEYIDTGKVKYVVRDFPLSFHQNAQAAANAANCAYDQGGNEVYFNYHDLLFKNQSEWESLAADALTDKFKEFATQVGLEESKFSTCLSSEKYADEINQDIMDGQAAGVSGTPTFFINGKRVVGAVPYTQIKGIIDDQLKR